MIRTSPRSARAVPPSNITNTPRNSPLQFVADYRVTRAHVGGAGLRQSSADAPLSRFEGLSEFAEERVLKTALAHTSARIACDYPDR